MASFPKNLASVVKKRAIEAKELASVVGKTALVVKESAPSVEECKEARTLVVMRCTPLVKEQASVVKGWASGLLY
jgi:hypothetical protein